MSEDCDDIEDHKVIYVQSDNVSSEADAEERLIENNGLQRNDTGVYDAVQHATESESTSEENILTNIKMPAKILKRGRPKGAECTVIGLPCKKKKKGVALKMVPFCKLKPFEKDRIILECLTDRITANAALNGLKLIKEDDFKEFHLITDSIRDTKNIDICRVQR